MNQSDERLVEQFVKDHEDLIEALGNEEKYDLYEKRSISN